MIIRDLFLVTAMLAGQGTVLRAPTLLSVFQARIIAQLVLLYVQTPQGRSLVLATQVTRVTASHVPISTLVCWLLARLLLYALI